MVTSKPQSVRGELLREWRIAQNLEFSDLARRANLSAAQIQQLETGDTSLFYSLSIRENAARKVAIMLGGDPNAVIRSEEGAGVLSDLEAGVVQGLVSLSQQRARAAGKSSAFAQHSRWVFAAVLGLVVLVAAVGWLHQKWQVGGTEQFWRQSAARSQAAAASEQMDTEAARLATTDTAASDAYEASAVPSATLVVPQATASTSATPVTAPPLATAQGALPAPAAVADVADAADSAAAALCARGLKAGVTLQPQRPRKAGDMVYLLAQKAGHVCVVDGAGVRTLLSLQDKEGRSVYGPAPWRVHFEQADQAAVFFQGERLRWPEGGVTTLALQEAAQAQ